MMNWPSGRFLLSSSKEKKCSSPNSAWDKQKQSWRLKKRTETSCSKKVKVMQLARAMGSETEFSPEEWEEPGIEMSSGSRVTMPRSEGKLQSGSLNSHSKRKVGNTQMDNKTFSKTTCMPRTQIINKMKASYRWEIRVEVGSRLATIMESGKAWRTSRETKTITKMRKITTTIRSPKTSELWLNWNHWTIGQLETWVSYRKKTSKRWWRQTKQKIKLYP